MTDEQPTPEGDADERRGGPDRRRRPTPMLSKYMLWGRRRGSRRDGEADFTYVDRPGTWIILAFASVVGLSLLDAWYTLDLLKRGATEANPVMRMALEISDQAFVLIKAVVTIVGASFLCLHKNWPLGRLCLIVALLGYSALLFYHLYAQQVVPL
ncbi:MAG: DUF5658 family protein [Planctomycetota bacterium]|nr:DUF5658 family protein [Planctomycetota bacterium]